MELAIIFLICVIVAASFLYSEHRDRQFRSRQQQTEIFTRFRVVHVGDCCRTIGTGTIQRGGKVLYTPWGDHRVVWFDSLDALGKELNNWHGLVLETY